MNDRVRDLLKAEGIRLAGIYLCPHHPDEGCGCRKPRTLMLETAARDHNLSLHDSYLIGDEPTDVEAGRRIGARTLLISTAGDGGRDAGADRTVMDLVAAAAFIAISRSRDDS